MSTKEPRSLSWIERLSNALLHEPQDREQLVSILHDAQENNLMDADAVAMMEGVLKVSEMHARDIMIPKSDITAIDNDSTLAEVLDHVIASGHSRFPVLGKEPDAIMGMLIAKDLLKSNTEFDLKTILRPAKIVPESKRLDMLLKEFRSTHTHMAMVVDEYGHLTGLVTMEDILEQIVGEIEDETDIEEAKTIEKIDESHYHIAALTSIEDFNDYFKTDWDDSEFDTVGGYLLEKFDHIPQPGETIDVGDYHFSVTQSDQRRIISLTLTVGAAT